MLLLSICMSLLENYLTLSFPAIFVKERYPWLKWVFMGILTLTSFYLDTLNYPFLMIVPILILAIFCRINYNGQFCISIFYIIFIFTLLSILDMFALFIENNSIQEFGKSLYQENIIYFICLLVNKFTLIFTYVYFIKNKKFFNNLVMKDSIMLIFSVTEIVMYSLMTLFLSFFIQEKVTNSISLFLIILLTMMFLLFFYQYALLIKLNRKVIEEELKSATLEFNKSYYEDFQKNYEMNKALSHDMKNHITLIYTMLQENKVDNAMTYIQGIYQNIGTFKAVKTEREILNYIIDSKMFYTKDLNIRYVIDIKDELNFMDNVDLCILLGNLLDNCIEAVEKVNNRFIEVIIDKKENIVFINIRNTYDSSLLKYENGKYISNKSDSNNHGIGMKNIESIINKYNGNIIINIDEYFNTYIYF